MSNKDILNDLIDNCGDWAFLVAACANENDLDRQSIEREVHAGDPH